MVDEIVTLVVSSRGFPTSKHLSSTDHSSKHRLRCSGVKKNFLSPAEKDRDLSSRQFEAYWGLTVNDRYRLSGERQATE